MNLILDELDEAKANIEKLQEIVKDNEVGLILVQCPY